jgi:uncharacterized membrane protein YtjA (UPF0391 family)
MVTSPIAVFDEVDFAMLRWLIVLATLSVITGLLTFGVIPTNSVGMTRILFGVFTTMLAGSLVVGIIRG